MTTTTKAIVLPGRTVGEALRAAEVELLRLACVVEQVDNARLVAELMRDRPHDALAVLAEADERLRDVGRRLAEGAP